MSVGPAAAVHNPARRRGMLGCSKGDVVTLTSDPPLATCW
jgi:hypothetical protein